MPYIGNIVQDFSVNTAMLNSDSVTSIKIDDGTIVNADINDSAAIAGSKISPDFGSQAISTTGSATIGGVLQVTTGSSSAPAIHFGDSDSGIYAASGGNNVRIAVGGSDAISASTAGGINFSLAAKALTSLTLGTQSATDKPLFFADANSVESSSLLLDNSSNEFRVRNNRFSGKIVFAPSSNVERARIDNGGKLLVGTSTARTNFFNAASTHTPRLQIESTNSNSGRAALGLIYGIANASGPYIVMAKHRSNTVGDNTVVVSGDETGIIAFQGSDGSQFVDAARIQGFVDGTPGADDMPGRLVFSTTADGAASPTERLRIDSSGNVGIGTTNPIFPLETVFTNNNSSSFSTSLAMGSGANADLYALHLQNLGVLTSEVGLLFSAGNTEYGQWSINCLKTGSFVGDLVFRTRTGSATSAERLRIDSSGHLRFAGTSEEITLQTSDGSDNGYLNLSGGGACSQNRGAQLVLCGNERSGLLGTCQLMAGNAGSASSIIQFFTGGSEQARVDVSGRLLIGTSTSKSTSAGQYGLLNIQGGVGTTENFVAFSRNEAASAMSVDDEVSNLTFTDSVGYEFARIKVLADAATGTADTPGRLVFLTTPDGGSGAQERLRIDKDGNVSIGIAGTTNKFHVEGTTTGSRFGVDTSSSGIPAIAATNESNADVELVIYDGRSSIGSSVNIPIAFHTNGKTNERMRLTTSGEMLVGMSNSQAVAGGSAKIQVQSNDSTGRISIVQHRNEASGAPFLSLGKTRATATNNSTLVQNGDNLGTIAFAGGDGTDIQSVAAQIVGVVSSTAAANDMPGSLEIYTTPDGTATPKKRINLTHKGEFQMGNSIGSSNIINQISRASGNTTETITASQLGLDDNNYALLYIVVSGTNLQDWGHSLVSWRMPRGGNSSLVTQVDAMASGSSVGTFTQAVNINDLVITKDSDLDLSVTVIGGGGRRTTIGWG